MGHRRYRLQSTPTHLGCFLGKVKGMKGTGMEEGVLEVSVEGFFPLVEVKVEVGVAQAER